jgi:hypothetical protein
LFAERVLIVGSVHLDTLATREFSGNVVTEPGNVVYAIGGIAYNIAANLAIEDDDSRLRIEVYTILPKYSVLTQVFLRKMKHLGISTQLVKTALKIDNLEVRGGGYVGVIEKGIKRTRFAVIDSAIHTTDVFTMQSRRLKRVLRKASIVATDTNMSAKTVGDVAKNSAERKVPLFISLGSEKDAKDAWLKGSPTSKAYCVCGRLEVIKPLLAEAGLDSAAINAFDDFLRTHRVSPLLSGICTALRTKFVLVIVEAEIPRGFGVLSAGGEGVFIGASKGTDQKVSTGNTAGVADAALSGFIYTFLRGSGAMKLKAAEQEALRSNITAFVDRAAASEGSTPGSVISFEEEDAAKSKFVQYIRALQMAEDVFPFGRTIAWIAAFTLVMWAVTEGAHFFDLEWILKYLPATRLGSPG